MPNETRLPAAREPIAEKTGLTSRSWYRFFSGMAEFFGFGQTPLPQACYLGTDGTSVPQWIPVAYSAMGDTTTQSAAANTPTIVNINSSVYNRGITLAGNKVTIAKAGLYTATFSVQLTNSNTSNDDDVTLWVRINGVDLPLTSSYATVVKSHGGVPGSTVLTVNIFYQFSDGDYLQLVWLTKLGNAQIITYPASTSPAYPAAPGVILTIAQVV